MSHRLRSALGLIALLFASELPAQPESSPDRLHQAFLSANLADTTRVIELGDQILKRSASPQQRFEVLEQFSEMYFRANNVDRAIAYAFDAKEVAQKTDNPELMAQAYGSIANQYSYLNLSDKARPYLNFAFEQIERLPPGDKKFRLRALGLLEMGKLDFNYADYTAANKNFRASLQQFDRIKNLDRSKNYHYRRSLYNIGNSYYYLKQPDSAELYLNRALKIKNVGSPDLKYFIYSTLAEVYAFRAQHKRAIDTLQAVLADPNFRISPLKAEIYLNLSRNYQRIGDKSNYTLYNERHLTLRDSVEGRQRKAISSAFDAEQQVFSHSMLASRQQIQLLIFTLLLLAALSAGVIVYLIRKKKRQHALYVSVIERLQDQAGLSEDAAVSSDDLRATTVVPQQATAEILSGLQRFEGEQGFRNPRLTVGMLAVELNTNPAYLSAVIKSNKGKNFNNYINTLRINYICDKIHTHPNYGQYKISFLAQDCGFVSHSAFSTVFKKITGISPSVFLNEEEKHHASQKGL